MNPPVPSQSEPAERTAASSVEIRSSAPGRYDRRLFRVGVAFFGAGFISALAASVLLSSVRGGAVESFGSVVHRLALLLVLAGGVTILMAYRLPQLRASGLFRLARGRARVGGRFRELLLANGIAFVALTAVGYGFYWNASLNGFYWIVSASATVICSLMVTVAVFHRGLLRGYAIGFVVGFVLNVLSVLIGLGWFGPLGGGFMLVSSLTVIQISGLASAACVAVSGGAAQRPDAAVQLERANRPE